VALSRPSDPRSLARTLFLSRSIDRLKRRNDKMDLQYCPRDSQTERGPEIAHETGSLAMLEPWLRGTYFLKDVTTAMSRLSTPACVAIRALDDVRSLVTEIGTPGTRTYGCNVFPTPTPMSSA